MRLPGPLRPGSLAQVLRLLPRADLTVVLLIPTLSTLDNVAVFAPTLRSRPAYRLDPMRPANSAPGPLQVCIRACYSIDSHPQPQRLPSPNLFPKLQPLPPPAPAEIPVVLTAEGSRPPPTLWPLPSPYSSRPQYMALQFMMNLFQGPPQATKGELYSACPPQLLFWHCPLLHASKPNYHPPSPPLPFPSPKQAFPLRLSPASDSAPNKAH
jgi:hypothetical protein